MLHRFRELNRSRSVAEVAFVRNRGAVIAQEGPGLRPPLPVVPPCLRKEIGINHRVGDSAGGQNGRDAAGNNRSEGLGRPTTTGLLSTRCASERTIRELVIGVHCVKSSFELIAIHNPLPPGVSSASIAHEQASFESSPPGRAGNRLSAGWATQGSKRARWARDTSREAA